MTKNVYQLISEVSAEICKTGISKDNTNAAQGYKFRGIDDVYNSLAPILSKLGLVILPRMISRTCVERTSPKGNALFFVTIEAEYDFISSHDGSKHTIRTFGEAMDSSDKATNKAMAASFKYAVVLGFCIPTEGDNDADSNSHEVAKQLPVYPEVQFNAKKVEWTAKFSSGELTADKLIAAISAKFTLTDAQKDIIKSLDKNEDIPQ